MKKTALLFFVALLSFTFKANAQENLRSFTIAPPAIQVNLNPGERSEGVLKITNDGPNPLVFNTSVQDFIVKDDNGTPDILPPNTLSNKYSGASWVAIYPSEITVAPHKRVEFNYYIQAPSDARPGGHYAAAIYTPTNTVGVSGTGAAVNTGVGTLFYITIKGPVTEKAVIQNFSAKKLIEWGPAKINTKIINASDIHIKPQGKITLTNMLGGKSDAKDLSGFNIFPGVGRNYETSVGKGFMLGRYKASLNATYGSQNTPLVASLTFWVFPWKLAAFIVLLAVALGVGVWYWKKDKDGPDHHSPEHAGETPEEHASHSLETPKS